MIGKNGVGKSSVLDLIGTNEKTKNNSFDNTEYFLIYHIKDDLYYFEGTMFSRIKNINSDFNYRDRRHFYFSFNEDGDIYLNTLAESNRINIYYSRNKIAIPWAEEKKISKQNSSKTIQYYEKNATFEDAYNTYLEFDLFYNKKRAFKIEQKLNYYNQPRYLSLIYEIDLDFIDMNSTHKMLLTEEGIERNNKIHRKYTRNNQDSLYSNKECLKPYFILRVLEKVLILNLVSFLENDNKFIDRELKYHCINKIINIRGNYFFKKQDINDPDLLNKRVQFLTELLDYLTENISQFSRKVKLKGVFDLVDDLETIPKEYYKDKNYILIPSAEKNISNKVQRLKFNYTNIFNFKFTNFSDGELVYLNLFSTVYKYIIDSKDKDCILLLDEPDINLHPEWSRKLIFDLLRIFKERKRIGQVQIIIATHSPFIASDFPKQNIFAFRQENEKKINIIIENPNFGFAANIYDLITDTFFMSAAIGEFAVSKIREINEPKYKLKNKETVEMIDDVFLKNMMEKELNKNDKN